MQSSLVYIFVGVITLPAGLQTASQTQCGVRQIKHTETIVRGEETVAGDWPWHAAIFHKKRNSVEYACGGTLINEHYVLTAEHCVTAENGRQLLPKNAFVRLGLYVMHLTEKSQYHEINRIVRFVGAAVHKEKRNDIALLELKTVVEMTMYVQPACVNEEVNIAGKFGTVVGWGFTEDDELSEKLRAARLQIRTTEECLESNHEVFGPTLHSGYFCAGYNNGTSACNGDSGGGLFLQRQNVWYLTGIVSFTEKRADKYICKPTGYTGFTKITNYLSWIQNNTNVIHLSGPSKDVASDGFPVAPTDLAIPPLSSTTLFPQDCGHYHVNRIIWGQKAKIREFPWLAIIHSTNGNNSEHCLGSLISKRYVLTSAACITGLNLKQIANPFRASFKVILGEHTLNQTKDCDFNDPSDCAPPIEQYSIYPKDITMHENYHGFQNSIALIRLNRAVTFKEHIMPICLPTTSALRKLSVPEYLVAGWGYDDRSQKLSILHKAAIRAVDFDSCKTYYAKFNPPFVLSEREICAGGDRYGSDLCYDFAAPLGTVAMHEKGLRYVQFGIHATGPPVCTLYASVYTKVASYMEWIVRNMKP